MELVRDAYWSWRAEVVFITSNYQGNQEIMQGCREEGIPAVVRPLLFPVHRFLNHSGAIFREHCGIFNWCARYQCV
jgi:hypothetical protein